MIKRLASSPVYPREAAQLAQAASATTGIETTPAGLADGFE